MTIHYQKTPPQAEETQIEFDGVKVEIIDTKPPVEENDEGAEGERGQWGGWFQYMLSVIGLSVGLGNVWRFPYLAFKNGGGTFVLQYIIMWAAVGFPLYYIEIAFGQYCSLGPISSFKKAVPIVAGIGYMMALTSYMVVVYYNVLMSYILFFTGVTLKSIGSSLPWTSCDNSWNSEICKTCNYSQIGLENSTTNCSMAGFESPAQQFWERAVLQHKYEDEIYTFGNDGGLCWMLVLCLFIAWLVTWFCLVKGVASSGKIAVFTAVFPYFMLIVLIINGLTLSGAGIGLKSYLWINDYSKFFPQFFNAQSWVDAASQTFFSLGVSMGGLIMMGSYNKFDQKTLFRDAMICSLADTLTAIFGGLAIFSMLGHLSHISGDPLEKVAVSGPGLAFVIYPQAIAQLPGAHVWALCFFLMLYTLGVDSAFGIFETALTSMRDEFPVLQKHKAWFSFVSCFVAFLLGFPVVTRAGIDVLDLLDTFIATYPLVLLSLLEILSLAYLYGWRRLRSNIIEMTGSAPSWYFILCWMIFTPLLLMCTAVFSFVKYSEKPFYMNQKYYPAEIEGVGWMLALTILLQLPFWAAYNIWKSRGDTILLKIKLAFKPTDDWGPEKRRKSLTTTKTMQPLLKADLSAFDFEMEAANQ